MTTIGPWRSACCTVHGGYMFSGLSCTPDHARSRVRISKRDDVSLHKCAVVQISHCSGGRLLTLNVFWVQFGHTHPVSTLGEFPSVTVNRVLGTKRVHISSINVMQISVCDLAWSTTRQRHVKSTGCTSISSSAGCRSRDYGTRIVRTSG